MAKKQRNSPERVEMLIERRLRQDAGRSLEQIASLGIGNYPGGKRRALMRANRWNAEKRCAIAG